MKFIKENKLAVLSVVAVVVCAILLAIPGQYAHFGIVTDTYTYKLSGYQLFFNTGVDKIGNALGSLVGGCVAILVLAALGLISIFFGKKSSFFVLLAAIFDLVVASLFFGMENFVAKSYTRFRTFEGKFFVSWPNYICASIFILLAIYLGYKAIMMMKDEIKHPSTPKGPSYNYLKK